MRAVAQRVGVTPMALYPHVRSKEDLLDGLVDRMLAELLLLLTDSDAGAAEHRRRRPADLSEGDWRARLWELAQGLRVVARRHPTTFPLLMARPSVTPDAVRATDSVYRALLDAGIPAEHVPRVERLLSTFVLGFATSEVSGRFSVSTNPRARRADFDTDHVLAHHGLTSVLRTPVDWDAEFDADLADLVHVVESYRPRPSTVVSE